MIAIRGMVASPERILVVLSLLFGLGLAVIVPPLQAPDEIDHFRRAFQITEGVFVSEHRPGPPEDPDRFVGVTGGEVPRSLWATYIAFEPLVLWHEQDITPATLRAALRIRLSPERRVFNTFPNSALASPLPYLPQGLGIALSRVFSDRVVLHVYAGRVANLVVATFLIALAVRALPLLQWAFVALALTPTTLSQSASLSSDALTNAVCFLWVALILRSAFGSSERMVWREAAVLLALGLCVGLLKPMYLALGLTGWLIPSRRLGGNLRRLGFGVLLVLFTAAGTAAWSLFAQRVFSSIEPGIDPQLQLRTVLADPLGFLELIARTLASEGVGLARQYLGVLGNLRTELPGRLLFSFVLVILLASVSDTPRSPRRLGIWPRLTALLIALVTFVEVCLSIHLVADAVGADALRLQGRYFVPLGPLLLVVLAGLGRRLPGLRPEHYKRITAGAVLLLVPLLALTTWWVAKDFMQFGASRPTHRELVALDSAFREVGQFDDVGRTLESALAQPSTEAVLSYVQAAMAEQEGRTEEAIARYRDVRRRSPEALLASRRLARLLMARGRDLASGEAAEAEALARQAARASEFADPLELEVVARALAMQERYIEAVRWQELAVRGTKAFGWYDVVRELEADLDRYRRAATRRPPR